MGATPCESCIPPTGTSDGLWKGGQGSPSRSSSSTSCAASLNRNGRKLVLVAGDVFDTYNPSAEAEELFFSAVQRLAAGGERAV